MQNDQQLQDLWQSIEQPTQLDLEQLQSKAAQRKRHSIYWLLFDLVGTLICFAVLPLLYREGYPTLGLLLFLFMALFGVYYTWRSFVLRRQGLSKIAGSTQDFNAYLRLQAQGMIKIGQLIRRTNALVVVLLIVLLSIEQYTAPDKALLSVERIAFTFIWCAACLGVFQRYANKQIKKGRDRLANLDTNTRAC